MPMLQRLGTINTLTALLERALKYGWPLMGGAITGTITAWATAATAFLHPYAPFSWVAAFLIGAVIFELLVCGGVWIRNIIISQTIRRSFYEQPDRINPLLTIFQHQRIHISDLLSPITRRIDNKTFIGCEIIGPENIVLLDDFHMSHCDFFSCDYIVCNNRVVPVQNGVAFHACVMRNCKLHRITFLVPETDVVKFERGVGNIKWLSDPRIGVQAT
jgi:hypothetical protein